MIIFKMFFGFIFCCFLAYKLPSILIFLQHFFVFCYWSVFDIRKYFDKRKHGIKDFKPFGVKMFCGRQGQGKTIGMVWYLDRLRKKYPKAKIYTNFNYAHQHGALAKLNDLLVYRNGTDGIIFALDEIQNEFSSAASKDFPETLLGEITMQRKQRIVILCSSQVFTRVAKPLREQCYEVMECRTFLSRWTRLKCYDAVDYNSYIDSTSAERRFKIPKKWKRSFIQSDGLRASYDTYAKVERLSRQGFASRQSRLV